MCAGSAVALVLLDMRMDNQAPPNVVETVDVEHAICLPLVSTSAPLRGIVSMLLIAAQAFDKLKHYDAYIAVRNGYRIRSVTTQVDAVIREHLVAGHSEA